MNLKEIFEKAGKDAMTYDQLAAAITENKAKFVDLSEGAYVDKQKYTDDLAARDTRITSLDETIKARDTDLAALNEKLAAAGADTTKLASVTADLTALQSKYDKDTKAYQKQIKDQEYRHSVDAFAGTLKFTSQAAKRDFVHNLLGKNLNVESGTIIGATDFVTAYAKDNADAFVKEGNNDDNGNNGQGNMPQFSAPSGNGGSNDEQNPFVFDFTGVRPNTANK